MKIKLKKLKETKKLKGSDPFIHAFIHHGFLLVDLVGFVQSAIIPDARFKWLN